MRPLPIVAVAAASLALAVGTATSASAADTTTTFVVNGGGLAITAPASKALGNGGPGSSSVSAELGNVAVTDTRAGVIGWGATAASTDFISGTKTIVKGQVNYSAGVTVTSSGTAVFTPGTPGAFGATPNTAYTAMAVVGNNSATWSPTLTVSIPADALAGTYGATVTHSVS